MMTPTMMMLTTIETVVMEQVLKLAPLLVRASFACACAYMYWYKNKINDWSHLDDFDVLEHADNHMQLRPTSDHSQPVPVGSGVIAPARADSFSSATDNHMQLRPMSDHSQPAPAALG